MRPGGRVMSEWWLQKRKYVLTPDQHQQRRIERELLRRKERPQMCRTQGPQLPEHCGPRARIHSPARLILDGGAKFSLAEHLEREPGRRAIVRRELVHDLDRVGVAPAAHEVLGRLV